MPDFRPVSWPLCPVGKSGRGLLLVLLLLSLSQGIVQAHVSPYTLLRFDKVTVADGLSNGAVNAIVQDHRGFMWFGTEDGLNRYDGKNFITYRNEPGNENSIASANFGALLQDSRGWLWLGTWGAGLDRMNLETGQITHFGTGANRASGFKGYNTEFVFEDAAGDIWIGTERNGLNRFNAKTGSFENFPAVADGDFQPGNHSVKAMAETDDGRLFIGTDAGLYTMDRRANSFTRIAISGPQDSGKERVRSLYEDQDKGLWIGTRGDGVKRLDLGTGAWSEYRRDNQAEGGLSENSVARVFVDSAGIVWVATYNSGLDRLDPVTGEVRNFDYTSDETADGISFRRIDAIYEDRGGVLWFGTRGGGLNKLPVRARGFKSYGFAGGKPHGLPHPSVRSIAGQITRDSKVLWIGTDGGGLVRLDSAGHFQSLSRGAEEFSELDDKRVWSVLADRDDRIWAGTYSDGLFVLDDKSEERIARQITHSPERPQSLSSNRVQVLLESLDGNIWVGTQGGLDRLISIDDGARFEHFRHDPDDSRSISDSEITALLDSGDGYLWVGTRSGLNLLSQTTGYAQRFTFAADDPSSLSSNFVTSLQRGQRGRLWVGTDSGGLNLFRPETQDFQRFSNVSNQAGLRISSILLGNDNDLWLGTGRGLIRFNPDSGVTKSFGEADGLVTMSFLRGAAYASRSGELYLGGLRGMVSFNPASIYESRQTPNIEFTSISRFDTGEELLSFSTNLQSEPVVLQHDEAFIRIEFAALDYTDPARNRYAHKLDGIDSDWIEMGADNSATYTGLPPGSYVFHVRAANADGVWNTDGVSKKLIVLPAYWQTWWFRLLIVALVGLLIYALHLARTDAIRGQNLELESLNTRLLDQINARNRIESEREALIRELEGRNAEMERFTYTVSHDLKSPLITIKGFLGLLKHDTSAARKEDALRDIDKIESATSRMHQLLDELLQFSRAGKSMSAPKPVNLGEVVDEALTLARGEIEAAGVEVEVADNLPVIPLDKLRMTEAFLNLITNAARFMGEQPNPKIEIGMRYDSNIPVYFVRDNGIGIETKHRAKIFNLFERLDSATPGTGIGLALVQRIIESHSGRVWVESAGKGKGSTFCFTLNENEALGQITD